MADDLDITPYDLKRVKAILQQHVPQLEIRAFGSRTRGTAQKSSDLDLVLMTKTPLDTLTIAELREAFSESDIPFKVDLVDWASTKDNFRQLIQKEYVVVQIPTI